MVKTTSTRRSIGKFALFALSLALVGVSAFFLGLRLGPSAGSPLLTASGDDGVRIIDGIIEVDIEQDGEMDTIRIPKADFANFVLKMFGAEAEPDALAAELDEAEPIDQSNSDDSGVIEEPESRRSATLNYVSHRDNREYDILMVKDGFTSFTVAGDHSRETYRIPYDVLLRAAEHQKAIFYPSLNIFSLLIDPDSGNTRWSFVFSPSFWQLVVYIGLILLAGILISTRNLVAQRNRLVRENRTLMMARETEREHLAAEIHDGPIQDAQLIAREFAAVDGQLLGPIDRPAVARFSSAMERLVDGLRDICSELRPPVLYHFGLPDALRCRIAEYEDRFPEIHFDTYLQPVGHLPEEVRISLFRIAQEAVANAVKHAEANRICIRLFAGEGRISMWIEDDGVGFSPPRRLARSNKHQGMSLLAHLAKAIDADVEIVSTPSSGTSVFVDAPLPETADDNKSVAKSEPALV